MLSKALIDQLADGAEHSRARLCATLSLDDEQLASQIGLLRQSGLEIVESGAATLRLVAPIRWIDSAALRASLSGNSLRLIESIEIAFEVASTNRLLLDGPPPAMRRARIAIAEYQTAGRGRRERSWTMPPGAGLALSVAWRFPGTPENFGALSLAVGASVRRAIQSQTAVGIGLKWPNDLIAAGGKLGGILVEVVQPAAGGTHVVAGVGINVSVPDDLLARVSDFGYGGRNLAAQSAGPVDRSVLAAGLIEHLLNLYQEFAVSGFSPYLDEWLEAHVLDGQAVDVRGTDAVMHGTVCGIAADGALIIESDAGERRRIISGDVTVRVSA